MLTKDYISDLLNFNENEHVEFKEAKQDYSFDKILKYCVAFANEKGGKLVLGVSDKKPRIVVGTQAFESIIKLKKDLYNRLKFRVDVSEVIDSDNRIIVIDIPSRPTGMPCHIDGTYWMRSGDELVAMSPEQLKKIFEEGSPDWLSLNAKENLTPEEVVALLDTQGFFDLLKLTYPSTREGVLERLQSERIIESQFDKWAITNLGAILFAKKLDDFGKDYALKATRVIVYEKNSKLHTNIDKVGNKGYAVGFEGLLDFVNGLIPKNEIITSTLREEIKMFPDVAMRELIANALVHQDFNISGASVMIEIYNDRVEISNPGKPFISTDRFIDEYRSRNTRLAELLRRVGICEEKGSGIDRVIYSSEAYQLPAPDFRVSETRTTAVLFAHVALEKMERKDRIRACYQHCCLKYVMNEKMTNQSLRDRFGLSEDKSELASRIIRDTVECGKIKLEDPSNSSKRYSKYIPFWA